MKCMGTAVKAPEENGSLRQFFCYERPYGRTAKEEKRSCRKKEAGGKKYRKVKKKYAAGKLRKSTL